MEKIEKRPVSEKTIQELYNFAFKLIEDHDKATSVVKEISPIIVDYNATDNASHKAKLKMQALAFLRLYIINNVLS